jgi:hypothetical protein
MSKLIKVEKIVEGKMKAGGNIVNQSVADTGRPKSRREIDGLAKKKIKDEKKNAERTLNAANETERKEKAPVAKKKGGYVKLNKSQKETNKIRRQFKKKGEILNDAEIRLIKKEKKSFAKIGSISQEKHYFRTLAQTTERRVAYIILMAVTPIIKGKLAMPSNDVLYKERSIAMWQVQTDNTSGYYTPVFSGLANWNTKNGLLDTAIKNWTKGTGTVANVEYARGFVQLALNLFLIYINGLALANQLNAISIIETSLCEVCKTRSSNPKDFTAKLGPGSGCVSLKSGVIKIDNKKVTNTYEFQYGYMMGTGIVWTSIPSGGRCKVLIADLPPGLTYFRKRQSTVKGGTTVWCKEIGLDVV